jgi:hypothetical protein
MPNLRGSIKTLAASTRTTLNSNAVIVAVLVNARSVVCRDATGRRLLAYDGVWGVLRRLKGALQVTPQQCNYPRKV